MSCCKKTSTLASAVCIPPMLDQGCLLLKYTAELERKNTSFWHDSFVFKEVLVVEITAGNDWRLLLVIGSLQSNILGKVT